MAQANEYNAIQAIEKGILSEAKKAIRQNVVDQLVKEFREKAETVVQEELEKLVIGHVKTIEEAAQFDKHLKVYVNWNGGEKELSRD